MNVSEFVSKWQKVELTERSASRKLDEAVFAAYGWDASLSDDEILAHLLALNQERASATPAER